MTSKYISNFELERFNLFYRPTQQATPDLYLINSLPHLDEVFANPDVFYTFVFINYPGKSVGHWCLLIKNSQNEFEWFDCLAQPIPEVLKVRLDEYANDHGIVINLLSYKQPLMHRKNWICGKWCMFRVMTLPNNQEKFQRKLTKLKQVMGLDDLVDFVVNFKI